MVEDHTTKQLLELRSLCADILERADELETRVDALRALESIDEELTMRQRTKAA